MPVPAAERARAYRARQKAAADAASAAERDARNAVAPRTMRDAVEVTLSAAKWLVASDAASLAQARALAKQVDELEHAGDTVKALSAHRALSRVLADVGATPTARLAHELRSRRLEEKDEKGVSGGGSDSAGASGNVTPLRPPKRRRSS